MTYSYQEPDPSYKKVWTTQNCDLYLHPEYGHVTLFRNDIKADPIRMYGITSECIRSMLLVIYELTKHVLDDKDGTIQCNNVKITSDNGEFIFYNVTSGEDNKPGVLVVVPTQVNT